MADVKNLTAEEIQRKEEAKQRRLANLKPFKPYKDLTAEELEHQKELTLKGGIARGEQAKHQKSMKEQALTLLNTRLTREQAERICGQSTELLEDYDLTVQGALLLSAVREVTENGNCRFAEFLRDTSGQAPKQQIEVQADVMTDADRELIANVQKRIV